MESEEGEDGEYVGIRCAMAQGGSCGVRKHGKTIIREREEPMVRWRRACHIPTRHNINMALRHRVNMEIILEFSEALPCVKLAFSRTSGAIYVVT